MRSEIKTPLTIYRTIFDKYASDSEIMLWDDVVELLYDGSTCPRASKQEAALFNGVAYEHGRRKHEFAKEAGMMILDIDHALTLNAAGHWIDRCNYEAIVYTSASHNPPHVDKFRIVIPLREMIPARQSRRVWDSLNHLFQNACDPSKRGEHSIFYLPGDYDGVANDFHHFTGRILSADDWMRAYPTPDPQAALPPVHRISLLKQMKQRLRLRNKRAMSWQKDGITLSPLSENPFVTENAVDGYLGRVGGWYHGRFAFLMSVASVAHLKGYDISPFELVQTFNALDALDGGYYVSPQDQRRLSADAARALSVVVR